MRRLPNLRVCLLLEQRKRFNPIKSRIRVVRENQVVTWQSPQALRKNLPASQPAPETHSRNRKKQAQSLSTKTNATAAAGALKPATTAPSCCTLKPKPSHVDLCKDKADGPSMCQMVPRRSINCVTSDVLAQKAQISPSRNSSKKQTLSKNFFLLPIILI
jgi:hypothetical protein